ncbi:hypothetical protein LTR37_003381 [Vermiconidia calcicola]|uniref:Uncharacterized protein n=1 Tax=Vermiconidia calcicola TaxID=1690605 RepID=A0ACC3NQK0_9PEZI|nr:hypothetical protein LTR37_003381 [Vermiconidia calcicola]
MAPATQEHFRLMAMPPELRLRIYELVFETTSIHIFTRKSSRRDQLPPLLLSNKQIYHEAIMTHYQTTEFVFCYPFTVAERYARIPQQFRNAISTMLLDVRLIQNQSARPSNIYAAKMLAQFEDYLMKAHDISIKPGVLQAMVKTEAGEWVKTANLGRYVEVAL